MYNATEDYNNMVAAKKWTNTYPKDSKILSLTNRLSKLDKNKTSALTKSQGVGGNSTQKRIKTKGIDPQKRYAEVFNNLESWHFNKSKEISPEIAEIGGGVRSTRWR